jgi:type II secretory ATPase GspE/PulE/Tfp pilus assembly ATPase PilB-like protein/putative methionine-R-sulfoxide reductase with GAF domain
MEKNSFQEFLFPFTDGLKHLFNCEQVSLFAIERAKREIYSKNFTQLGMVKEIRVPISNKSILGFVAATGKSINIKDSYDDEEINRKCPGFSHDKTWDEQLNFITKSILCFPIAHEGKMLGIMQLINSLDKEGFKDVPDELPTILRTLGSTLHKIEQAEIKEKSNDLIRMLDQAECIDNILISLEQQILNLFEIEIVTIYAIDQIENKLYSKIKSGGKVNTIRLAISEESIAGYVALNKQPLIIEDVYNPVELNRINPKLTFNNQYDLKTGIKSSSMLVYPLVDKGVLFGVIQLVNKKYSNTFMPADEAMIEGLARVMSSTLRKQFGKKEKQRQTKLQSLINSGYISEIELNDCYSIAKKEGDDVETVLLEKGFSREQLGKALECYYSLPYQGFNESFKFAHSSISKGLSDKYLLNNHCVPIQKADTEFKDDPLVIVVVNNPGSIEITNNIKSFFSHRKVEFRVGLKVDIEDYIHHLKPTTNPSNEKYFEIEETSINSLQAESVSEIVTTMEKETAEKYEDLNVKGEKESTIKNLVKENFPFLADKDSGSNWNEFDLESNQEDINLIGDNDNSLVRLTNKILTDATDTGASDIHIEPGIGNQPIKIRFRKDGRCFVYQEIPASYKRSIISRIKIMAKLDIAERRFPQDGKIKLKYGSKKIEYRVVTVPTAGGNEDAILRVLASSKPIPITKMNFSERNLELLKQQITKPYGLFLVVGPTGSGKTTTLHSCLGEINKPDIKIWTAEDPIEITQNGLRQVQVQKNIGFDFADAMKTFLRGDPDVIMVGEMRDQKTCSIGLEASLTGHLVFSTLHTNSAPETIVRLVDLGMNPLNFADALLLIAAQRLVRTLCNECKEEYNPSETEFNTLAKEYGEEEFKALDIDCNNNLIIKKPVGCPKCNNTGYAGRIGLHELLHGSDDMKRLIMDNGKVEDIRKQAKADGMTTLKQDGILKVFNGDCDLRSVLAVCAV